MLFYISQRFEQQLEAICVGNFPGWVPKHVIHDFKHIMKMHICLFTFYEFS